MPFYTYVCPQCEEVSGVEKPMTDPHPAICPHCGYEGELGRVFDIPGITFRGSGFHHTDKAIDEITDPEYQLSHEDQIKYYDEKLKDGKDRKIKVFT